MAAGETTTQSLADSLPTLIQSARIVREYAGVMPTVVDKVTLGKGQGLSWKRGLVGAAHGPGGDRDHPSEQPATAQ